MAINQLVNVCSFRRRSGSPRATMIPTGSFGRHCMTMSLYCWVIFVLLNSITMAIRLSVPSHEDALSAEGVATNAEEPPKGIMSVQTHHLLEKNKLLAGYMDVVDGATQYNETDSIDNDSCATQACLGGIWKRVVVLGDLHGDFNHTVYLLLATGIIDSDHNWIASPATLLVQVGDIVDRWHDSYAIFRLLRRLRTQAFGSAGKVIQIIGNHESMNLLGDTRYISPAEVIRYYHNDRSYMKYVWSPSGLIGGDIRKHFEVASQVGEVVFVHAGLIPKFAAVPFDLLKKRLLHQVDVEQPNRYSREDSNDNPMEYIDMRGNITDEERDHVLQTMDVLAAEGPLWTKSLTLDVNQRTCKMLRQSLRLVGNNAKILVVGHTVTSSHQIETICGNRLISVDTGISRGMIGSMKALEYQDGVWREISVRAEINDGGNKVKFAVVPNSRYLFSMDDVAEP